MSEQIETGGPQNPEGHGREPRECNKCGRPATEIRKVWDLATELNFQICDGAEGLPVRHVYRTLVEVRLKQDADGNLVCVSNPEVVRFDGTVFLDEGSLEGRALDSTTLRIVGEDAIAEEPGVFEDVARCERCSDVGIGDPLSEWQPTQIG